ncbi:MAG TPA: outer membrane protein assembly factor [Planctomycetaceae bacterium]|nr:outer membrane protein assembly factor [Planctomycetaceae bacterium]
MPTTNFTSLLKKSLHLMHKLPPDLFRDLFAKHAAMLMLVFLTFVASLGCQTPGVNDSAISNYAPPSNDRIISQNPATTAPAALPAQASKATDHGEQDAVLTQAPVVAQISDNTTRQDATYAPIVKTFSDLPTPGSNTHYRSGQPVSGQYLTDVNTVSNQTNSNDLRSVLPAIDQQASTTPELASQTTRLPLSSTAASGQQASWMAPGQTRQPGFDDNTEIRLAQATAPVVDEVTGQLDPPGVIEDPINTVPLDVELNDTTTGRFMFGIGVNSDAGLTGQIMVNERNFNYRDIPLSLRDLTNGRDFRDGGQGLRIEAIPGNLLQRYMFMFTDPYFIPDPTMSGHDISLNISGFYYDRRYYDWYEQRLGGRAAFGYRITDDLSLSLGLRAENVTIHNPRVLGIPQLDEVLGDNELYSGQLTLSHDTRDVPFLPTEGHFIELAFSQAFGTFSYPRAEVDLRRHFLLKERADGSGRQTLSVIMQAGFSGSDTPIYERFFAGGFSTIRGFDFRGASPVNGNVVVGGDFKFITSIEYMFPVTADDMLKGVAFCDLGTVEEDIAMHSESFRVSPGFGLRIAVPMLGPAPLALDFAVPINYASTDQIQHFSFFLGLGRG